MLEAIQIEFAAQFAIDSREQILVECGGDACRIIVGEQQLRNRLDEVRREQKRIAFAENGAHLAKELISRGPVEIANRAAEKKNQQLFAITATRGHFLQALQIRALKSNNAHGAHLAEFLAATKKSWARNINRVVIHALPPRESFQQITRILSAAAAKFRYNKWSLQFADNVRGMALQKTHSRAAQPILRQQTDYVEKHGPHFIV